MREALEISRDITTDECPWLPHDLKKGDVVYKFTGATYGCITYSGEAISFKPGENPFYEVPRDALRVLVEIPV